MSRITTAALALVIVAAGGIYLSRSGSSSSDTEAFVADLVGAANAQSVSDAEIDVSTIAEMSMGNPDAPVTVVEYASYTCPHCARFHEENFKKLKADYIDSGKINFVYREVYFDRFGLWASAVARCGGPEKFFGISDLIYKGQDAILGQAREGNVTGAVDEMRRIGRLAGLENETLEACLQDAQKMKTLIAWFEGHKEADGIDSTPSFVINGKKYNNMAYSEMSRLIDEAAGS